MISKIKEKKIIACLIFGTYNFCMASKDPSKINSYASTMLWNRIFNQRWDKLSTSQLMYMKTCPISTKPEDRLIRPIVLTARTVQTPILTIQPHVKILQCIYHLVKNKSYTSATKSAKFVHKRCIWSTNVVKSRSNSYYSTINYELRVFHIAWYQALGLKNGLTFFITMINLHTCLRGTLCRLLSITSYY